MGANPIQQDQCDSSTCFRIDRFIRDVPVDWEHSRTLQSVIGDNPQAYEIVRRQLTAADQLTLAMAPGGGSAIGFRTLD